MAKTEYIVHFDDGDSISGRMNATPETVQKIFSVGNFENIGFGPQDKIRQVTSVEIHSHED
ncbi:hypothetical protein H8S75_32215 [Hungatella sp. L12]|uniref:DUF2187 domain-containing protein n=1 Tax=Hungatella hominis TaxID=2763050 RepID=A0ABR7HH97_9FIRM|nr:hypothetical protein [Hungatella hominis]MBC5712565.1 hypothetical protein [Hungatella hominis]